MSEGSTDTEPDPYFVVPVHPLPCGSRRGNKRKSNPQTKETSQSSKTDWFAKWALFLEKFNRSLGSCKTGCAFCLHNCFGLLQPLLDEVKKWREEMSHVVSEVQDLELRWIFKPDPDSATITPRQALARPSRGTGDGQGSTTSTSEVDDAGQSTSTSNPADSDSDSGHEEKVAKQTSRHYSVRQGSKRPSVRIGLFLHGADKGMRICQKAAVWALGISKARLHRATRQH